MLLGYKAGQKSDGMPRKPGESQDSFAYAGASGYIWVAGGETRAWGGVAPQPLLGLQEQVLLPYTSKEKAHLSLWMAEAERGPGTSFWAGCSRLQAQGACYLGSSDASSIKFCECRHRDLGLRTNEDFKRIWPQGC